MSVLSSSDIFYKNGKEIRSSYLVSEVNLDNLDKGLLQIQLRPYDKDMLILRKFYDLETWSVKQVHTMDCIFMDCVYDEVNDTIEFNMFTGFDLFLFNICALLGIVTLKTHESNYDLSENGVAHIYQRVSVFYLSLEEFKMLDGFIGKFNFNGSSVTFQGLVMRFDCIHESVCDGAHVPGVKSECLKRGESLLLLD